MSMYEDFQRDIEEAEIRDARSDGVIAASRLFEGRATPGSSHERLVRDVAEVADGLAYYILHGREGGVT